MPRRTRNWDFPQVGTASRMGKARTTALQKRFDDKLYYLITMIMVVNENAINDFIGIM